MSESAAHIAEQYLSRRLGSRDRVAAAVRSMFQSYTSSGLLKAAK